MAAASSGQAPPSFTEEWREPVSIALISLSAVAPYLLTSPDPAANRAEVALPPSTEAAAATVEPPAEPRRQLAPGEAEIPFFAVSRDVAVQEAMEVRRRSLLGQLGEASWSVSAERRRAVSRDRFGAGRTSRHRALLIDAGLGWKLSGDWLTARVGAEMDKRPDLAVGGNQAFAKTRTLTAGVGWSHGGRWRLDFVLRSTTAQARSPVARLVDLASGAARAERQAQVQLALAPIALGADGAITLGAQASVAQLVGFDRSLAGPEGKRNTGAALFARIAF